MQSYHVPATQATARIVEKKSEFIGYCSGAANEAEALDILERTRKEHRTANHNVYAYILRDGARQRYSDDGEPAKTAGLPVLEAISHAGLTNCIIVVTRYFGGTLLGTGGLVRAYTAAAKAAIDAAGISTIQLCVPISVTVPYSLFESARRLFIAGGAKLDEPVFTDCIQLTGILPSGTETDLVAGLTELLRGNEAIKVGNSFYSLF